MSSVTADDREVASVLAAVEKRFADRNPLSRARHERACAVFPSGQTRQTLLYRPFPVTITGGSGAALFDLDGHSYVDFINDFGCGLYGHTCKPILEAVHACIDAGLSLGAVNSREIELAEILTSRFPSMAQVRFCNSGSEASLFSALLARHVTGRRAILVFHGCYHGGFLTYGDVPSPLNVPFDIVKCTYNDLQGTQEALQAHGDKIAAVMIEPLMAAGGSIPAREDFLAMLRFETRQLGVLLIFDEVMTSRLGPSGVQGLRCITPDITVLGKFWGGGFNFGAFGASREFMRHFDVLQGGALSHAGTFNNNVVTMTAGAVGAQEIYTPEASARVNALGETLRAELNSLGATNQLEFQATGLGSLMTLHWHRRAVRHPGDVEPSSSPFRSLFQLEMMMRGYYVSQRGFITLSLALTEDHINSFLTCVGQYLTDYRSLLSSACVS